MDQIEEINTDLIQVKNEQCIVLRTRDGKVVLTNPDEIGLKEWSASLRSTLKCSHELLSSLAKKAGKIYGTSADNNSNSKNAIFFQKKW
uniref:PH domain-containing protein n=2 Tax=Lepeophtheirus salmonis TaxID=72036 RepID=A0A0K2U4C7_LEPSM